MSDELIDLYTRDGTPAGLVIGRGEPIPEGLYYRVCAVWLVNAEGKLLIQRRSMRKPTFPGRWCSSAGGVVQAGESDLDGAIRETQEELGITPDLSCGQLLMTVPGATALHAIWLFRQDVPLSALTLQAEEVDEARYVTPEELRQIISGGGFVRENYIERMLMLL